MGYLIGNSIPASVEERLAIVGALYNRGTTVDGRPVVGGSLEFNGDQVIIRSPVVLGPDTIYSVYHMVQQCGLQLEIR